MDAATRNRIEATGRSLHRRALNPLSAWQAMLRAPDRAAAGARHAPGPRAVPPARPPRWRPRRRCRPAPPLARPDRPVRRHAGRAGARAAGHLGDAARRRRRAIPRPPGQAAEARVGAPHLPSPAIRAAVASAVRLRRADPRLHRHRRGARRHRPARRRLPRVVPGRRRRRRWACSPRSAGCRRCTRASRRSWRRPASRSTPSTSMRWATPPWSISSAPRRKAACSAPTRCATASTCPAARCGWWCSSACPGRARTSCTASGASICRDGDPKGYDDRIARLRLRQAFGRLIRRATDRGVFVLLDRQTPIAAAVGVPGGRADPPPRAGRGGETNARFLNSAWVTAADRLISPAASLRFAAHRTRGDRCAPATRWTRPRPWS